MSTSGWALDEEGERRTEAKMDTALCLNRPRNLHAWIAFLNACLSGCLLASGCVYDAKNSVRGK